MGRPLCVRFTPEGVGEALPACFSNARCSGTISQASAGGGTCQGPLEAPASDATFSHNGSSWHCHASCPDPGGGHRAVHAPTAEGAHRVLPPSVLETSLQRRGGSRPPRKAKHVPGSRGRPSHMPRVRVAARVPAL